MSVSELDLFKIFHEKDQQYHASAKISHVYNDVKNILQTEEFMPDQLTSIQNCWKKYRSLKNLQLLNLLFMVSFPQTKQVRKTWEKIIFKKFRNTQDLHCLFLFIFL